MNTLKTMFLLTLLTLLLVFIGQLIGGKDGMVVALIFAFVMNFFAYWFSDKIVLMMYRAKEVSKTEAPRIHKVIENLIQKADMPKPRIYIIPQPTPNAFATGRNPKHAAVAVTEGIVKLLSDDELEGVLSHELSHVRNRDILLSTIVATIAGAIYVLADWARWTAMWGGRRDERGSGNIRLIAMLIVAILAPIVAMLIQMAISRSREYLADESGANLCGRPLSLANALRKLYNYSQQVPLEASPTTAHMFTVSPLAGGGILALFSTHPPIERRIARLEELAIRPR